MNTEHGESPAHPAESFNLPINQRLFDLERERVRLVAQYDEVMARVEDGDDTGFTLTRITKRLNDVNREIERVRGTS